MCVQVVVTFMHVQQVSVLPPGIDVRKLQHSHSELSRVEPLSGLPSRLFFGLPIRLIRFSVFTQTLSDLTLDWSKVRSDKLLCVHMALVNYLPSIYSARYTQRIIQTVKVTGGDNFSRRDKNYRYTGVTGALGLESLPCARTYPVA